MSLVICNNYPSTVYLSYMWYDPANCGSGDHFDTIGWYQVNPGACRTVFFGNVNFNRYWAYYAEAVNGAVWNGNIQAWVSNSAYRLCHGATCTPCRVVGFRLLDVDNFNNYTLTLIA